MTAAADSNDISSLPQADQDAIGATLISLMTGFRERDAEKLVGIYTPDADWVNAFGTAKRGGDIDRLVQRPRRPGPPSLTLCRRRATIAQRDQQLVQVGPRQLLHGQITVVLP